jgi:hypothetical protein
MKMDTIISIVCRFLVCTLAVFLLVGAGCSKSKKADDWSEGTDEKEAQVSGPAPIYYDFEDIQIPAELSLVKKKSFVYSTASFTAGVLVFEGRVTQDSLVNFFTTAMAKDGWELRSSFRYGRVILSFEKGERSCLIGIDESSFNTRVEVWVAPQVAASESY